MSILQGYVIETHYPPAGNCIVSTMPAGFTLVDTVDQTETANIYYGSCSMSCNGDFAVVAHSSRFNVGENQILTFKRTAGVWALIDTKSFDPRYYTFSGQSFYRNNDRVKITGDGKRLFIVLEAYANYGTEYRIVSYIWDGTTWTSEQTINLPPEVAEIGVISVSYDGKVLACLGVDGSNPRKYVHMIWENGSWIMTVFTEYTKYFIYCGVAMSSDGSTAAFGNSGGSISGDVDAPVKIYSKVNSIWTETGSLNAPDSGTAGFSYYGACLALNSTGDVLAIGAPLYNTGSGDLEAGKVYIANLTP